MNKNKFDYLFHIRVTDGGSILPTGGCTLAAIVTGDKLKWGVSRCSEKDNFCKKVGRAIASTRAQGTQAMETRKMDIPALRIFADLLGAHINQKSSVTEIAEVIGQYR